MKVVFENCLQYNNGKLIKADFSLADVQGKNGADIHFNNCVIFPAFCDVHVHLREPGFFYKETVASGTAACARGGYSDVFSMPNLNPVPDSIENIRKQIEIIEKDAVINVHPYASITVGQAGQELSDFAGLSCYAAAFSDDGKGVQSRELMRSAMIKAKELNKVIAAHCEDNSLLFGGCIHKGEFAKNNNLPGLCSESEWGPIKRDIELVKETGCAYHVCHVSTKESVKLIRRAKQEGVNITCETAPHYLVLNDSMLRDEGRFKMNPPIRAEEDRLALIDGIKDGTIDMIATDHAPHSLEEKSKGLRGSLMGIAGIETAFAVLYTKLVKTGVITLEHLIKLMSENPRKRFRLPATQDICVFDLNREFTVNPNEFLSKGKSTPFEGEQLWGICKLTVVNNKVAYINV